MTHCSKEQLESPPPEQVVHRRLSAYGAAAIVRRCPETAGLKLSPVTIEELFVSTVKEDAQ